MVPTLIMGGVILAFSQLIAYSWLKIPAEIGIMDALNSGKFSGFDLSLLKFAWLSQSFGGVLFGFAIPMFAAFVANSIGGKLAFPAGFIGGLMSTQPTQLLNFDPSTMQWATSSPVPSTFIGALIISIVAGYLVKWMNQKIQLPDFLLAFKTTFLLPILSAIFVMLAMYYVITPFGGWINGGIRTVLTAAGEKGALMYAMGIRARPQSTLVAQSTKRQVSLPSALPPTTYYRLPRVLSLSLFRRLVWGWRPLSTVV